MGVLNITPDSFSDGGQLFRHEGIDQEALCRRADAMVSAGAAVLDIGGESTRPGAAAVSEQQELDRVLGALTMLRPRFDVVISLDTSSPSVMDAGAAAGCQHDQRRPCPHSPRRASGSRGQWITGVFDAHAGTAP